MGFSRQDYWSVLPFLSPGDLPDPRTEPRSPALQADSLPSEPPGEPKNTGVGILSLLQGIFLTQESNQGLLHCRWLLCHPMDRDLPGSSIHGIFQARILEWVPISFSRGSSQPKDRTWVSHTAGRLFITGATREASLPSDSSLVTEGKDIFFFLKC